ncbi:MAG: rhamnulokinase [bacterium]|jgi:rhamnulokinase
MKKQCYLGVDLGAESGRVIAGLFDGSRIEIEEVHRFPNMGIMLGNTLRWDVLRLWSEIRQGLYAAAKRFGNDIVSVGVDTWGVDHVLLSKNNELLGLPYHYRDARTQGIFDTAFRVVSREEIFDATGLQFIEFNTLFQLLATQRDHPDILSIADCLLMMPDFFHWCLSGVRVSEFTEATTSQCYHPVKKSWSYDLLERFNLPTHIFPQVVEPGFPIGSLLSSVADEIGLQKINVVAPATHDTGSAVAAVPTVSTGNTNWAYISSGTWSLPGVEVQEAILSRSVLENNFTNEGGVDGTYRLLKNIMGLWLVQQCKRAFERQGKSYSYADLTQLAAEAPSFLALVNPNDARFMNPPDMPAAIQDYCRETGQRVPETEGQLIRCALESLALVYSSVIQSLEKITGEPIEVIHIVGGGSQNRLLNQLTANACRKPVITGPVEATVLGNVLVQARTAGEVGSLEDIRAIVRASTPIEQYEPQQESEWSEAAERFEQLVQGREISQ